MNQKLSASTISNIEKIVDSLLAQHSRADDNIFDIFSRIMNAEKIELLQSDIAEISGYLQKIDNKWIITLNKFDSTSRKIFTLAHELGHYFLHKEKSDSFVDGGYTTFARNESTKNNLMEIEANEFAGQLVMPHSTIRKTIPNTPTLTVSKDIITTLSQKFSVSSYAMAVRLQNLNYKIV